MRKNWLSLGLLGLLFASLSVLVLLTKKPICMDSKLVEKIDRVTPSGTMTAWQCSANRWISFDEKFTDQLPVLSKSLGRLEHIFDETRPLQQPISVVWIESNESTLRLQGHTVYLSEDLLLQQKPLLESMIRFWLREQREAANLDRTLLEGAVVDLVMGTIGYDPEGTSKWPSSLYTVEEACERKIAGPKFLYACDREHPEHGALILGSARSVLSLPLLRSFQTLDLTTSRMILRSLPDFWLNQPANLQFPAESAAVMTAEDVHVQLNKTLATLWTYQPTDVAVAQAWKKWMQEFKHELAISGYQEHQSATGFDQLIMLGADTALPGGGFLRSLLGTDLEKPAAILDQQNLWMLPTATRLDAAMFPVLTAGSVTYISCLAPTERDLQRLQNVSPQLMVIRFCGDLNELGLHRLLKDGPTIFIASNPEVSFVQLFLPSLTPELRTHLDALWPVFAGKQWDAPVLQKLGWQEPEWDKNLRAYRSHSVNPAIKSFRWL